MRPFPSSLIRALRQEGDGLRVAIIRLGALGDVLRTLPPVRLMRRALPRARIYWVVEEKWRTVLEGHPDLDGLVEMPRKEWRRLLAAPSRWVELPRSVGAFRRRLRALEANLVLDFQGNLRSGLTGWLTAATVRLGYAGHQQREGNHWFNTHHRSSGSRRTPRMERNLDLVRVLGVPDRPLPAGDLPLVDAGHRDALRIQAALLPGASDFAIVAPGASPAQAYKKPPPDLLAAAGGKLADHRVPVLVVWGPGEEEDAREVASRMNGRAILAPPTDLATLAALLDRARLFVGGDSGPLHLACAVGCPVIALYGPTDPEVNQPWGVSSRSVFPSARTYTGVKRDDRRSGFAGVEPGRVEAAVEELLAETHLRHPSR